MALCLWEKCSMEKRRQKRSLALSQSVVAVAIRTEVHADKQIAGANFGSVYNVHIWMELTKTFSDGVAIWVKLPTEIL